MKDPFDVGTNDAVEEMMRQFNEAQNNIKKEKEAAESTKGNDEGNIAPINAEQTEHGNNGVKTESVNNETKAEPGSVSSDNSSEPVSSLIQEGIDEYKAEIPSVITWDMVADISSGKDDDGPRAFATVSLDEVIADGTNLNSLAEIMMEGAVYEVYIRGGAAVFELTIPRDYFDDMNVLRGIVERYFNEYKEKDELEITMTFVPVKYRGELSFLFMGLVYYNSTVDYDEGHVTLVFDNNQTIMIEADEDEINYKMIEALATRDVKAVDEEIDNELYEVMQEEKRLQSQNWYAESLKEEMHSMTDLEVEQEEEK